MSADEARREFIKTVNDAMAIIRLFTTIELPTIDNMHEVEIFVDKMDSLKNSSLSLLDRADTIKAKAERKLRDDKTPD